MAGGPRIEPFWLWDWDPDLDELRYRTKCCANYRPFRHTYSDPDEARLHLSIHLRDEHGMMIKPHLLLVGEVPEREE